MTSADDLERRHTLSTAAARFDELRMRAARATTGTSESSLSSADNLELLALGEVIIRKIGYGRRATVHAAHSAGASWTQIGSALGCSKQAAWEAHTRWLQEQTPQ